MTQISAGPTSFRRRLLEPAARMLPKPVAAILARRYLRPSADFLTGYDRYAPNNAQHLTEGGVTRIRFSPLRHAAIPTSQRVLIAPGHDGQFRQFLRLSKRLADAGVEVDLLVLPGHSGPRLKKCSIREIVGALRTCVDRHGPYDALITHCVSSNAALFALEAGPLAPKVIFLSAPINLPALVRRGGAQYGLHGACLNQFVDAVSHLGQPWSLDRPWQPTVRDRSEELLVLHCRNDTSVPVEDAAAVSQVWPGARMDVLLHGDHNSILTLHEAIDRIVAFVVAPICRDAEGRATACDTPERWTAQSSGRPCLQHGTRSG